MLQLQPGCDISVVCSVYKSVNIDQILMLVVPTCTYHILVTLIYDYLVFIQFYLGEVTVTIRPMIDSMIYAHLE